MKTDAHPRLRGRATALTKWLRQRIWSEALYQLASGVIFLAFGAFILAALLCLPVAFLFSNFELEFNWRNGAITAGSFLVLLGLSFVAASRNKLGLAYPRRRQPDNSIFEEFNRFLLSAPGQLWISFEALQKFVRLLRCDAPQLAVILICLFDRRRKATVEEICEGLSGDDSVRLLPQLRDIPGVIWLMYGHGVIILSLELRLNMAREMHEPFFQPPPMAETPPPRFKVPPREPPGDRPPKPPRPPSSEEQEMISWYVVLNLPPFASLEKVRQRYRQLVKIYHPDAANNRRPGKAGASEEQIKRINEAYHNILKSSQFDARSS